MNVEMLVEGLRRTSELAESELRIVTATEPLHLSQADVVTAIYAHAITQSDAVAVLLLAGFSEQAKALVRSFYDLEDQLILIGALRDEGVKRYVAYDVFARLKFSALVDENEEPLGALEEVCELAKAWSVGIHAATAHEAIRQLCERIIGEREPTSWFACIPNRKKLRDEFRTKFISIEATHLPGTDIGGDDDKSLVFGTIMSGQVHASPTVIMNRLRSGLRTGPTAELSDSTALMTHTMMERISSGYAAVTATSRNRSRWDETRRTIEVGAY